MSHARFGSLALGRHAWFTLLAFVGSAEIVSAGDWFVDQSYSNCSQSDGSAGKPYCTIGGALAVAVAGDTIHVATGTYKEQVALTIDMTLIGTNGAANTFLDSAGPIVSVDGASLSIRGFTIQNGGPGLEATNGATLAVTDCVVTGNTTLSSYGAGLQAEEGAAVTITGTTFTSNTAPFGGGGISVYEATCTILDCVFDNNAGGAIHGLDAMLTLESSTIKNHAANAIYVSDYSSSAVTTITSCTFANNVGSFGGGAIRADSITALDIAGCTFTNNVVDYGGGAIFAEHVGSLDIADSTFDANTGHVGGALRIFSPTATCERCTFHANEATVYGGFGGVGGAVEANFATGTSVVFTDCLFDSNVADAATQWQGSGAGALSLEAGPTTLVRCRFVGNASHGAKDQGGGALYAGGTLTATDCEFTGNVADSAFGIGAGPGAILVNGSASNPAILQRCTIGGNTTTSTGGGLLVPAGGTIYLGHTIVAGNAASGTGGAPDVNGFVTSQDWNDFGNTSGMKKLLGPNDLMGVDPLFVDPLNGDFSLQPTSPCIDSGDPSALPSGPDVGSNPRLLDGNLDGVLVLDRGAREFNNVHLDVSGTPTPGGTLTLTTSGTSGLTLLMLAGSAPGDLFVHPFGDLFIDLTQPFLLFPFGTIPNNQVVTLDPSMPAPVSFWLQEAALGAGAGNFSNVVEVDVK